MNGGESPLGEDGKEEPDTRICLLLSPAASHLVKGRGLLNFRFRILEPCAVVLGSGGGELKGGDDGDCSNFFVSRSKD